MGSTNGWRSSPTPSLPVSPEVAIRGDSPQPLAMRQGKNLPQLSPVHAEAVQTLPHAAATADGPIIPGCTPFTHPSIPFLLCPSRLLSPPSPFLVPHISVAPVSFRSPRIPLSPFLSFLLSSHSLSLFSASSARPPRERWRRMGKKSERGEKRETKTNRESATARARERARESNIGEMEQVRALASKTPSCWS